MDFFLAFGMPNTFLVTLVVKRTRWLSSFLTRYVTP